MYMYRTTAGTNITLAIHSCSKYKDGYNPCSIAANVLVWNFILELTCNVIVETAAEEKKLTHMILRERSYTHKLYLPFNLCGHFIICWVFFGLFVCVRVFVLHQCFSPLLFAWWINSHPPHSPSVSSAAALHITHIAAISICWFNDMYCME